jgi:hypothetical protein
LAASYFKHYKLLPQTEKQFFYVVPLGCDTFWTQAVDANVPEKRTVSLFISEDGDIMFFQELVSTYNSAWCHNPREKYQHLHQCEKLKSHKKDILLMACI